MGGTQFELGGIVLHGHRQYVMRGYSRLSGDRQFLDVEDPETGLRFTIPADEAYAAAITSTPVDAPPQPSA